MPETAENGDAARDQSDTAILVENAYLDLPLRKFSIKRFFRQAAQQATESRIKQSADGSRYVRVLDGINLRIERGTRLGLIGENGAGKSSLLRMLAGIYPPTSGRCIINGRISTLFANKVGMNPQASGRENIYLSARMLGMTSEEIESILDDVISFAAIGEFIDLPLHTYSAGMQTRLGFGIATSLQPDILLVDEIFGVGDRKFGKRAKKRIESVMGQAGTLVFASHMPNLLRQFCNSVCWVENGQVTYFDDVKAGIRAFNQSTNNAKN